MAGKGSGRRRRLVPYSQYSANWDNSFNKSKDVEKEQLSEHELNKIVEHIVYTGNHGVEDIEQVKDKLGKLHFGEYDEDVAIEIIKKHLV
jgi:hypothetical protein